MIESVKQAGTPRRIDGRRLRSERTKQLIIEAYLDLLRQTSDLPTAAQIADRAGYSVRSLFERFDGLLELSLAAADYGFAQAVALAPARDIDGDRATRIRSQVETRAQTCEQWMPLWRALVKNRNESEELVLRINRMREVVVARLRLMYRPELATLEERAEKRLLIALEALTDFECWARMREDHRLSLEDATQVWCEAIDRLLPATPVSGSSATAKG